VQKPVVQELALAQPEQVLGQMEQVLEQPEQVLGQSGLGWVPLEQVLE
jgi:hypothetical protein